MKKKNVYATPTVEALESDEFLLLQASTSIKAVSGDAGIKLAGSDESIPETADARGGNIWDDED